MAQTGVRDEQAGPLAAPAKVGAWWLLATTSAHDAAVSAVALHPTRPIAVRALSLHLALSRPWQSRPCYAGPPDLLRGLLRCN